MKQKLRKLVHKGQEYLYRVNTAYNTKGDNTSLLSVRIFLSGEKNTPLCIDFITIEDEFMGQPLNGNINLLNKNTQTEDNINLNEPKYIPKLIDWAETQGWTSSNKTSSLNGLLFLQSLGYDTSPLQK
ncbi:MULTISPECIES: hypothetical protein [Capnocytophaga]|uniref:Uncharacterized protein n=1 Tax=Capnocytophaga genosp. AHN8471 TaxID=327574 RepID=A0ABS1YY49_9FLAO|nr:MULTISPECIES: hypothetical protein [Capnocytophaga]MBI1668877.1 hypothetical protein [Capnocytophaga periodontitidis]MBM0651328.1 hypothetical protein [Capnocytophaga genosp. AHN8471]MBM0663281.1 hypothetical protein [Capnocytophaga genosp. AHN8471]